MSCQDMSLPPWSEIKFNVLYMLGYAAQNSNIPTENRLHIEQKALARKLFNNYYKMELYRQQIISISYPPKFAFSPPPIS